MTPWPTRPAVAPPALNTPVTASVPVLSASAALPYVDCQTITAGASYSAVLTARAGDGVIYAPASYSAALAAPVRCPII